MELDLATLLIMIFAMIGVGLSAGLLSGIFGLGGGIILVPALYYLFQFLHYSDSLAMHLAVATSLALSVPATYFSFRSHLKKESVDVKLLKSWGITITFGVFLGAYISTLIGGALILKIFAIYLILVAIFMAQGKEHKPLFDNFPKEPWRGMSGLVIGSLSSLLGIGGGTLTVPKMTMFGIPMRQAVGTASALSCLACILGVVSHITTGLLNNVHEAYAIGYVNWLAFLVIAPLSIVSAKMGAKLVHKIDANQLRRYFALILLLVSAKLLNDIYHVIQI